MLFPFQCRIHINSEYRVNTMIKKKIVLGICGSIAAYKIPELVRQLIEKDCEVKIVLTKAGSAFVTKLTLQVVSGSEVYDELFATDSAIAMEHIDLARWADLILIAPATAHMLGKLAQGLADDLLTTLCLATTAPLMIAPAMNQQMWQHPAVQANVSLLMSRGVQFIGPEIGLQACGDYGPGRMTEPVDLVAQLNLGFQDHCLKGQRVLITAGPTQEAIDPVRYLTNRSSGKMGYALAQAATMAGAEVTLITGPTNQPIPLCKQIIAVTTAAEMFMAVKEQINDHSIFIAAAAVADYYVKNNAQEKIKHTSEPLVLTLEPTVDILAYVGHLEKKPFTVGFAAETNNLEAHAQKKRQQKNADLIIANDVSRADIGFDSDDNEISVISAKEIIPLKKAKKSILSQTLMKIISDSCKTALLLRDK